MNDFILILNYHSLNSKTIARMLRNNQIYATVMKGSISVDMVDTTNCKGIIICGDYVGSVAGIQTDPKWFKLGLPVLGIGSCAIAINMMFGGKASESIAINKSEKINYTDDEYKLLKNQEQAMVIARNLLPAESFKCFASTTDNVCIDICHKELKIFAIQRVLERNDPLSIELVVAFAKDICNCDSWWNLKEYLNTTINNIKTKYSDYNVVCAISGGVDSAVATQMCKMALGSKVKCIFVDNGFFRKNEVEEVYNLYANVLKLPIKIIDSKDLFLDRLEGIAENSAKDIIIRNTITKIIRNEIESSSKKTILVAGVNYNDVIFKVNNNGEEDTMQDIRCSRLFPIENIFKFEVRKLAEMLMLPDEIVYRQPFPSSGLALRIVGEITLEKLELIKLVDSVFTQEIIENKLDRKLWQYYAILSPYPGLKNKYAVFLKAVQSTQNQVAYAYRLPYDLLERVTAELRKNHPQIRHVLYDVTPSESFNILE